MNETLLDAEAVAGRYANRPGYRFLAYREVGISVFAMNLNVLAIESRDIPPIEEFLLKFIYDGVGTIPLLSDLTGLDRDMVESRLIDLRRNELINVISQDDNNNEIKCVLTQQGKAAVKGLRSDTVQDLTIPNIIFHGLLRRVDVPPIIVPPVKLDLVA